MPEPKSAAPTHHQPDNPQQQSRTQQRRAAPQAPRAPQQPAVWAAGARLHFGLLDTVAPFGGAGMMVDRPQTRIAIEPAERFDAVGAAADRVVAVAQRFARFIGSDTPPACRVRVLQRPRPHCGLGTGTQLALLVAAALDAWTGQQLTPETLARDIAGRGARSMIGSHGFFYGGLLTDPPLPSSLAVDSRWRVLLVRPNDAPEAVSGEQESRHFARLPPATAAAKQHLQQRLFQQLVPAVTAADFDAFSEAVYQFNRSSGMLFAAVQGGPYHGAAVTRVIDLLLSLGVRGVGQSSWGPTVFAFCRSADDAQQLAARIAALATAQATVEIACPRNHGVL